MCGQAASSSSARIAVSTVYEPFPTSRCDRPSVISPFAAIMIGIAILLWWFIWSLVRNTKGILALNENRPIANPTSWMFG